MTSETKPLEPVIPDLFSLPAGDEDPPALLGGFCQTCNQHYFPKPKYCPNCLEQVPLVPLNSDGIIYSYTVVRIKPPLELPSPYSVVYVDLPETGLRVFGLFDPAATDKLRIGLQVELAIGPMGINSGGNCCLRPYFKAKNPNRK